VARGLREDPGVEAEEPTVAAGRRVERVELVVVEVPAQTDLEGSLAGRLGVMMANAEMSGLVCSGAMEGKQHTYALLDERASEARRLDRDEALAELVLRYFTGHGPATERDLAYWATMTLVDVRAGLADVADQLDHFEHDGRTYWFGQPPPDEGPSSPRAHLLQVLDEYHNGYQDSRYVLDVDGLVPRGRGATMGMALVDGQMVGELRRTIRRWPSAGSSASRMRSPSASRVRCTPPDSASAITSAEASSTASFSSSSRWSWTMRRLIRGAVRSTSHRMSSGLT
jgi:hypothetical protein